MAMERYYNHNGHADEQPTLLELDEIDAQDAAYARADRRIESLHRQATHYLIMAIMLAVAAAGSLGWHMLAWNIVAAVYGAASAFLLWCVFVTMSRAAAIEEGMAGALGDWE